MYAIRSYYGPARQRIMKDNASPVIPITPLYAKRKKIHPRTIHGL